MDIAAGSSSGFMFYEHWTSPLLRINSEGKLVNTSLAAPKKASLACPALKNFQQYPTPKLLRPALKILEKPSRAVWGEMSYNTKTFFKEFCLLACLP